jgi:integrase
LCQEIERRQPQDCRSPNSRRTPNVPLAAGVEEDRLREAVPVHELRHFAATALEQGIVGKLRTEIVGHVNEELTNSINTHVRRERVAAVAADYDPLGAVARS